MKAEHAPHPTGAVNLLLRAEGAAALAISVYAYWLTGAGWLPFLILFLAPDLSMLGYAGGSRIGAICYNAAHSYLAPALAWMVLRLAAPEWALPVALIWAAHIGFDRMLGYGLKYAASFHETHLSVIGRRQGNARG
jgi:hypothetical protein